MKIAIAQYPSKPYAGLSQQNMQRVESPAKTAEILPGDWAGRLDCLHGFPVRCKQGEYHIVQGLTISEVGQKHMQDSYRKLLEERGHVQGLLG